MSSQGVLRRQLGPFLLVLYGTGVTVGAGIYVRRGGRLRRITSLATLAVFAMVNLAAIQLRRREGPSRHFNVPLWVSLAGFVACLAMIAGGDCRRVKRSPTNEVTATGALLFTTKLLPLLSKFFPRALQAGSVGACLPQAIRAELLGEL